MRSGLTLLAMMATAVPIAAQEWQPGSAVELVRRAAENRSRRDIDTLLSGWRAAAHGVVRFAAEVDQGTGPVERLIKADQLLVEVYGEGPNRSKQVIVAWRDTTIRPTAIHYHRDHLGIIANDFGATIRLGEGDEVRDVPHPLSGTGLEFYRFRLGGSILVSSASGTIRVVMVDVRPADPSRAGVVGVLALDADRATLVRASLGFTAASYRDPTVSSITVVLENALQEGGIWLPWRQAIAIRRGSTVLSLPITTVIRADWTIDDYRFGIRHPPALFQGPSVGGLQRVGGSADFRAWDDLLAAEAAFDDEIRTAADRAAGLVRHQLLEGLPRVMLAADGGVSRILRINRVQGVTIGAGFRWRAPGGVTVDASGAVGTSDGRPTGRVRMSRPVGGLRMVLHGGREVVDANPWPRRSLLANSLATMIDGSDAGDWYLATSRGALAERVGRHWSGGLGVRHERVEPMESRFRGFDGGMMGNPHFVESGAWLINARVSGQLPGRGGVALAAEYGNGDREWTRLQLAADWTLPAGVQLRTHAGVGSSALPPHRWFVAGGAGSLTGTVPRELAGRSLARFEVSRPVDIDISLPVGGRYTAAGLGSRVTPFAAFAAAGGRRNGSAWPPPGDEAVLWTVGVRLELWGPLLQVELGWAPARGTMGVAFDAHPDWWPLL